MAPRCKLMNRRECDGCMDCEKPLAAFKTGKLYIGVYHNHSGSCGLTADETITSADNGRKEKRLENGKGICKEFL